MYLYGFNVEDAMTMKFEDKTEKELAALKQSFLELLQDQKAMLYHLQSEEDYIKQLNEFHDQIHTKTEVETLNEEEEKILSELKEDIMKCYETTGIGVDFKLQAYIIKSIDVYHIVKHYKLLMLCTSMEVKIIVDLMIDMRDMKLNYQVEKLQMKLKDKTISAALKDTLAELEKSKDLVNAVRFLSSYGWLRDQRKTIFTNLEQSEEFSECVTFPQTTSGETIIIFDPDWPDIKIHVNWVIQQNFLLRAESYLSVFCKVSRSKEAYSKADFLTNLPQLFKQLLQKEGEEGALRSLIKMVKT
ncbi:uncharacterized protein LOC106873720 isoform X2 [Octopus bimaculoides]|uniref:uncharacterized protein LOC106873720 isoform X2 n=1 Tax=Octopus bimaculoides TaxID=37653 RepID=UPI00071CAAD1|nr:uncharacterized protein LOC106873720 isoform X2 [Octopus bimaculoides]|eukprot:XP_014776696.1 PREDICTED: uncharacterized protein LOC106873720 isoform X2 [Octopus bimaculoides]